MKERDFVSFEAEMEMDGEKVALEVKSKQVARPDKCKVGIEVEMKGKVEGEAEEPFKMTTLFPIDCNHSVFSENASEKDFVEAFSLVEKKYGASALNKALELGAKRK